MPCRMKNIKEKNDWFDAVNGDDGDVDFDDWVYAD